jgi:thiamine-phosphate pyrophosphorylase
VGLATLRQARTLTRRPLVAIGGITRANARGVLDAGADGLAVISDLAHAPDPAAAVLKWMVLLKGVSEEIR